MPISLIREPHIEPQVTVATTAEIEAVEKQDSKNNNKELESTDESNEDVPFPALPMTTTAATGDDNALWPDAPDSAPMVKEEDGRIRRLNIEEVTADKGKRPAAAPSLSSSSVATTSNEKATAPPPDPEHLVKVENLAVLASELGITDERSAPLNKDGRVYIFQFGGLLPPLDPVAARLSKTEGQEQEEEGIPSGEQRPDGPEHHPDVAKKGGYIGNMVVHKSGKTTFDFGGISYEVRPGNPTTMVRTAVLLDEDPDRKGKEKSGGGGEDDYVGMAVGMGDVMGSFVLAPEWKCFGLDKL